MVDKSEDKPEDTKAERAAEKAAAAKVEAKKLAPASESADDGVRNLLAERAVHAANGSTLRVEEIDKTLADLGYAAE